MPVSNGVQDASSFPLPGPGPSMSRNHVNRAAFTAALVAFAGAAPLDAAAQPSGHQTAPVVLTAARRGGDVIIDGRLEEAAWAAGEPARAFRQVFPTEGAPASQRTEVRVLYDEQALYVGARMYDSLGSGGIRSPLARRDQLLDANGDNGSFNSLTSDKLVVVLDPYHNHIDQVLFEVNPAGVRGESFSGDASWDPVWEAEAVIDSAGWTAELRIPFSQLRFSREEVQTWGLQVLRLTDRLHERDMWSFRRRSEDAGAAFFGHLEGIRIARQPRQVELMPYVLSRHQNTRAEAGAPFSAGEFGMRLGPTPR